MNVEDFRLLYEYNSWANRRTLDACSALNTEQFTRDLGSSFPSVRDTLSHICEVESLWLERWQGHSGTFLRPGIRLPHLRFAAQPLGRSRAETFRLRERAQARRYRPRDRAQNHQRCSSIRAALANAAAPRESRHLSPRPGRRDASPTRRKGELHRLDLLLPRTRSEGLQLAINNERVGSVLKAFDSRDKLFELFQRERTNLIARLAMQRQLDHPVLQLPRESLTAKRFHSINQNTATTRFRS